MISFSSLWQRRVAEWRLLVTFKNRSDCEGEEGWGWGVKWTSNIRRVCFGLLAHEYEKQLNLDAALLLNINMKGSNID